MNRCLIGCMLALQALAWSNPALAQTWSGNRSRPPLWQIISVDATSEDNWPYGSEDTAGDGVATFESDEQSADLRTLYADADNTRVWVRAYVSTAMTPDTTAVAFFFIDSDYNNRTGGPADDPTIFQAFDPDPTSGGYEYAVGISADGQLLGSWAYSAPSNRWTMQQERTADLRVEVDVDNDPIGIGARQHGYFQFSLAHTVSGIAQTCNANFFVRIYNDDPPDRAFGDDDGKDAIRCRPRLNNLGDPAVLGTDACTVDNDCPAGGSCSQGICVFDYACTNDNQCQSGEQCSGGRCVRVVDATCSSDSDCNGFVCVSGSCAACTDSGAAACAAGLVCTARGDCVDPANPSVPSGSTNTSTSSDLVDGKVRGGAFTCAISRASTPSVYCAYAFFGTLLLLRRRKRR